MWFEDFDFKKEIKNSSVREQVKLLCQAVEKSSSIVMITDTRANIEYVNPKFTEVTGYERDEVIGKNTSILNSGHQSSEFYEQMWEIIKSGAEWRGEFCNCRKSGETYWAYASISSITDEAGEISHYICIQEDFTEEHRIRQELKRANRKLAHQAGFDALTDLPNRRHFDEIYERELARARRTGEALSVLMIDIDFFKNYNDAYGHPRGDECLKKIASVIDGNLERQNDFAARYGGEEFVVVLPGTALDGAKQVSERIRFAVEDARVKHPDSKCAAVVTVSIGAASCRLVAHPDYELLNEADAALYKAKELGRNKVVTVSTGKK